MNKIGIYYAYWAQEWDADFHPYIDKVASLGFDLLEVNAGAIAKLSSAERAGLLAHAVDRNVTLTYCIGLPKEYDLAAEDQGTRKNGIAYQQKMAKAIGEMGGGVLGGIIYTCWPMTMPSGDFQKQDYVDRSVNSMKEAIQAAEDNHVFFNMEVVNRFEQFFLNTCAEAIAYIDAVGSPNAKIMLDTFHMNIEEDFIGGAIRQAGKKLGHFHIGENNRMPPGFGHIPWTEVSSALREIDYQGHIVMEPFLKPGGQVGRDIKVFRDLSSGLDMDEEARKAQLFIRGLMK
jgi:D-psicose/D-tagatose/L-ribulose 3-epimerase